MKILFWHRLNKVNAKGESSIQCRITVNGERCNSFSTGIFCKEGDFLSKLQRVRNDEVANLKLQSIKHKIEVLRIDLENKGHNLTAEILKEYYLGKKTINISLLKLMDEYLVHRQELVKIKEITDSTYRKSEDCVNNVNMFLTANNLQSLLLSDVTPKRCKEFYYWMQTYKKSGQNHSSKTVQIFKAIIDYAVIQEYLKYNPLHSIKFKRGPAKKVEFLTPEEVETLANYKFTSKRLQEVANLFLLQCYTGLSYADLSNFQYYHIETDNNGKQWINKPRSKNGQLSILPLCDEAKKLLEPYTDLDILGNKVLALQVPTNQKYNSYLKEIGDIVGFTTVLTTHIGRKTFGTIALNKGYRIEEVSAMLGHTNIKTTQRHYAVILRKII